MSPKRQLCLLFASAVLCGASDPPWKEKQIPDWDADDAKLVLADSPWAGSATATIVPPARQRGGGLGRGGIGIGLPGIGMGRSRGGYPGGQPPPNDSPAGDPPVLQVRWESALPIREAELKAREVSAPDIDESCYAIAVYGVPARMASGDEKTLAAQFKRQAAIKRDGQKDLKPSSVQVLQREDGPVIVYLFPRKVEITRKDRRVEFDAQIATLQFMKAFYTGDMTWQGKLEL
jgi:hypothetical protein